VKGESNVNQTQAIAAMKKLWGAKAAWRYNEHALRGEDREQQGREADALREKQRAAKEARDARRAELLKDSEYLRLVAEYNAAEKAADLAAYNYRARRVTVGYTGGGAGLTWFHVVAEGDNWQDAIDAAKAKNGKA
jgi:phage protein D